MLVAAHTAVHDIGRRCFGAQIYAIQSRFQVSTSLHLIVARACMASTAREARRA
jgi:hypothetical protein